MASSQVASSAMTIRQKYRQLGRLVQRLQPESKREQSWQELRDGFRRPLLQQQQQQQHEQKDKEAAVGGGKEEELLEQRLKLADERISFLKMITPKRRSNSNNFSDDDDASTATGTTTTTSFGGGKWIYKNGQRLENINGTLRDQNERHVISNWDGKNMDPDSVKRHNHHLKRLGFRNNAHAKGIF